MSNVVVIGGGIVGCHIAYRFAKEGHDTFLLEKEGALGEHTSTRNSGVIHGGIYYASGSLKSNLCVRGRHLTYSFLKEHAIPHHQCGKVIVALEEKELGGLEKLWRQGEANGVENLKLIDGNAVRRLEPRVRCLSGLHSPETGILDMGAYIRKMERILVAAGVTIVKRCQVVSVNHRNVLTTSRGEMEAEGLINAAGLFSDEIALLCGLEGYRIVPFKGDYYNTTEEVIRSLVYPVPDSTISLGVHLTRTLAGETLIGPSALPVDDKEDYGIRTPREEFEKGALAIIPDLDLQRIYAGYSGNRPKVTFHGQMQTDFVITKQEPGRIHLLGIESPGMTAAPAIAEYVVGLL
jgi:L-2-hydroxyglutarate oxidase LhgO